MMSSGSASIVCCRWWEKQLCLDVILEISGLDPQSLDLNLFSYNDDLYT